MADIYQQKGFKNRNDYLFKLSVEHGVPYDAVVRAANKLGSNEDFGKLVELIKKWED